MFSRALFNTDASKATQNLDPAYPNFRISDRGYGKNGVRIFQLKKNGALHDVIEYRVNVHLKLSNHKEYYEADNSALIGSDVFETIVYIYAQKYGLRTPEEFALSLTQYYLDTFELAMESNVLIEVMGWQRLGELETQGFYKAKPHDHAFLQNLNGRRSCEVVRRRDEAQPLLIGGIQELKILKTAHAPFLGFLKRALATEFENAERILSVVVNAKWEYKSVEGIDFATHWYRVRDLIIQNFAGHPVEGTVITSVQYFSYKAETAILAAIPEICSVSIKIRNLSPTPYDFSRFPHFEPKADVVIVKPLDETYSAAYLQTDRMKASSKL